MATDWHQLTVTDLRRELKQRSLPQAGKKADLVERLVDYENKNTTPAAEETHPADDGPQGSPVPEPSIARNDEPAAESELLPEAPTEQEPQALQTTSPAPEPVAVAPPTDTENPPTDDAAKNEENTADLAPADPSPLVPEPSQETTSRKRRSRSPPPEDEMPRKRARPSGDANTMDIDREMVDEDVSYAVIKPYIPKPRQRSPSPAAPGDREDDHMVQQSTDMQVDAPARPRQPSEDAMDEDDMYAAPAEHRATAALYIRNLMRPLRDTALRDYLSELVVPRGSAPDPDAIEDYYLDHLRTHAFVRFRSVAAASRVRARLHGIIWPNERERKELWVDFIPEEAVAEWANRERTEGGRGSRWEVRYDLEHGESTALLVNLASEPPRRPSTRGPPLPPQAQSYVPTGRASSTFTGVQGAPVAPRGRGANTYQTQSFPPTTTGASRVTRSMPVISYRPVPEELAQRRLRNLRSYYTRDRHRDLGREDEINRYTFQNEDSFVDRGKEIFIGIRPPHLEERRRNLGAGRGGGRGGFGGGFQPPPFPRRGADVYFGDRIRRDRGGRDGDRDRDRDPDRTRDVPRSRFDGAPLPTFEGGSRFGGGGGGRRDGYRGPRR
ncbi:hypothetical protein QBC47DRAFT_201957 [Echria macrotheca]|uniref:SAP domain-containing protein n=1 Tax=Echria macrotheca TaxID=438768 RepID=A0AAJ0F5Q8_9PEZI|nr:hypothetical protein QBC47DRAFT_201957 [Echria macrotheca]